MPKDNRDKFILSTQVRHMKENGLVDLEMDMGYKNGQMELYIQDNGTITVPKEKVNSFTSMAMSTKATG